MTQPREAVGLAASVQPINVRWFDDLSPDRTAVEHAAQDAGLALPIHARSAWIAALGQKTSSVVALGPAPRDWVCCEWIKRRALPGYFTWRVRRWMPGPDPDATDAVLDALSQRARKDRRILRVDLQLFSRDGESRRAVAEKLRARGFQLGPPTLSYARTLGVNLAGLDKDAVWKGLETPARTRIRNVAKFPVELRPITTADAAKRMNELSQLALARTGATQAEIDFIPIIELSRADANLLRLVGLFRTDVEGPENLVAFALGLNHGDHVVYDAGGSARVPEFKSLGTAYPLIWDLMVWASGLGVRWFDLGGVTDGRVGSDDPLGGISTFKSNFSRELHDVSEEWSLVVRPIGERVANAFADLARSVSKRRSR